MIALQEQANLTGKATESAQLLPTNVNADIETLPTFGQGEGKNELTAINGEKCDS